jgi:hypothetical protein
MGFSQGYQVNLQLRKGEKIMRNWSNKGLCVPGVPACKDYKPDAHSFAYSKNLFGDLANGRIGNGTHEYTVPLASGEFRGGALLAQNLAAQKEDNASPALHVKDAAQDGVLILRMPSSYVYHTGKVDLTAAVSKDGSIAVQLSENNGLDWKDVTKITESGAHTLDLKPFVYLRYDYRLKFTFKGSGTGLDALKFTHDIQHSQRPLPALSKGENKLEFSAGRESTITVEGSVHPKVKDKQLVLADFHPTVEGKLKIEDNPLVQNGVGTLTVPVETPGDLTRLRFGFSGRLRDARDKWELQVSLDEGKTFKTAGTLQGPALFGSQYVTFSDIPAGTRKALVRYAGDGSGSVALIFNLRIDADYVEPQSGFHPIKITYAWEENGQPKQDTHVAKTAGESYSITCAEQPVMKSISLEWAE